MNLLNFALVLSAITFGAIPAYAQGLCESQWQDVLRQDQAMATAYKRRVMASREKMEAMVQSQVRQWFHDKNGYETQSRDNLKGALNALKEAEAAQNKSEIYGSRISVAEAEYYLCMAIAHSGAKPPSSSPAPVAKGASAPVASAPTARVPPAGGRLCEPKMQEAIKHDLANSTRFKTPVARVREVLESMVQDERRENPDRKESVARSRENVKEMVSALKEAEAEKNQSEIYSLRTGVAASEYRLCMAIAHLNDTSSPNSPAAVGGDAQPSRPAPAGGEPRLSQQQITSCSDEIKRAQIESQSWTGNADDVAARLGRFQKDLFEGRCAGHPEARAYVVGAMKMLAYGGNPAGSGGGTLAGAQPIVTAKSAVNEGGSFTPLAPLRPDTKSKEHNPAHNASTCIQIYGPAEMKARNMHSVLISMIVNTCPYAISVLWCVASGNGRVGDCNPGYSNLANLDARGSRGIDADNQKVNYAACRLGKDMGFQAVEKDPRFPFRFSCS